MLVKFQYWAFGVSELGFWKQMVDVWLLFIGNRIGCRGRGVFFYTEVEVLMACSCTNFMYAWMNQCQCIMLILINVHVCMVNVYCNECLCIDNIQFWGHYVLISNIYFVSVWMVHVELLVAKSIYSLKLCVGIYSP